MTRKEALTDLLAKVEGGDNNCYLDDSFIEAWDLATPKLQTDRKKSSGLCASILAGEALKGDLDAAKALHEAVLPGWVVQSLSWWPTSKEPARIEIWGTHNEDDGRWHSIEDGRIGAAADDIARAWLIAIIKALIAMENDT